MHSHGCPADAVPVAVATEIVLQLRTHTERPVRDDVVHSSPHLLPGRRPHPRETGGLPAHVGPGRRRHLHTARRIRVGSDQWMLRSAQEKKLALTRYVCCLQCFDAVGWAAGRASSL